MGIERLGRLPTLLSLGKAGLQGAWGTTKFAGRMAVGNVLQRSMLGATVGGFSGLVGSDAENATNRVGDIAKGALFGATIGAAAGRIPALGRSLWDNKQAFGKLGLSAGKHGLNMAQWVLNNPTATLMTVGGIGAAYAGMNAAVDQSSPTMEGTAMNLTMNQQAAQQQAVFNQFGGAVAPQQTVMPMARYQQMANSTQGLVQGLHAGRHR